jgi:hypothetical protein
MARGEVFLSHAAKDRRFAGLLAERLRAANQPVWYAPSSIRGAQQWHDEIGAALERCRWFIVVLTPASVSSLWVKQELLYALNDRRYRGRIVPIEHRPADFKKLSWTLGAIQRVKFRNFEQGVTEVLKILR